MVVGHTKFSPDRHFGTLKKKIKETGCISIIDLLGDNGIVRCSSNDNFEITYKDPYSGERNFEWYDWDGFLKKRYSSCTGIQSWHVIKVADQDNFINVAKFVGEPFERYNNVKLSPGNITQSHPAIIEPLGISEDRLQQLKYFDSYIEDVHKPYLLRNY